MVTVAQKLVTIIQTSVKSQFSSTDVCIPRFFWTGKRSWLMCSWICHFTQPHFSSKLLKFDLNFPLFKVRVSIRWSWGQTSKLPTKMCFGQRLPQRQKTLSVRRTVWDVMHQVSIILFRGHWYRVYVRSVRSNHST